MKCKSISRTILTSGRIFRDSSMINRLFAAMLLLFFSAGISSAQVVDMRAYSRQRGFKAYQVPAPAAYAKKTNRPAPSQAYGAPSQEKAASAGGGTSSSVAKNGDGEHEKIRQTGVKIFQEKDEDKVLNFDVENSEFKKLNKNQQQDLMKRISFE